MSTVVMSRDVFGQSDQKTSLAGADFEHGTFQRQRLLQHKRDAGPQIATKLAQMGVTFEQLSVVGEHFQIAGRRLHAVNREIDLIFSLAAKPHSFYHTSARRGKH